MLALTRKVGEAIRIDENIRVSVSCVSGNRVQIVISAPSGVVVEREEVWERRREFAAGSDVSPEEIVNTSTEKSPVD